MPGDLKWWQKAVFYQIYPRSFADSTGNGIGDLEGMTSRLDYLQDLGIDAVWLSPHYPSPQFDCGYDITDYTAVNPEYGTMDDFRRFLDGAHRHGIRVILDLVLNHTSDQHPWFQESRSSRNNPKRDWYVWRDGCGDEPPNNWQSTFSGSAWELDPATGQYYYHFFFKQQPDLNWHNLEVKRAMFDAVRFWLDLGVDGFRLDAIETVFEDPDLTDHPVTLSHAELRHALHLAVDPEGRERLREQTELMFQYQQNRPEVHGLMQELRCVIDEYPERVLVGETGDIVYHGNGSNELHMVFNFPLMESCHLTPAQIQANQAERVAALPPGAWPCNTLGNHDSPRLSSRYGDGRNDTAMARVHLALMLTLRGTPFLYNGEEIGMSDHSPDNISQFRDMLGVWYYDSMTRALDLSPDEALSCASRVGRDRCRTPMQWANTPNGGFCPVDVEPWLPVNPDYVRGINVAEQRQDRGSLLNFYRGMLRLRRETPALVAGDYHPLADPAELWLAFLRRTREQTCLIVLNFSERTQQVCLELDLGITRELFSSHRRDTDVDTLTGLRLSPFEVYIAELS